LCPMYRGKNLGLQPIQGTQHQKQHEEPVV